LPLYYQLQEIFKEKIKEGTWKEDEKVPPERELMEKYNVSRTTVRKALDELFKQGLIYRKQGVGTFVSKPKVTQNLFGEISFVQQANKQGLIPSSKIVYSSLEHVIPKRIKNIFNLNESEKIYKIIRVRLLNNEPLILETLYIPQQHAPEILKLDLEMLAICQFLVHECELDFTHSTLDIEPIAMNEFESQHLGVVNGTPALSLERIIYGDKEAFVIQKRIMRGDRGKFSFTLSEKGRKENEYSLGLEFENNL
jgi:GntR family transcriptional regulator